MKTSAMALYQPYAVLLTANSNLEYKTPKRKQTGTGDSETLQTTLPWPIAVVKWYRIYADWYKPDPADLGEW